MQKQEVPKTLFGRLNNNKKRSRRRPSSGFWSKNRAFNRHQTMKPFNITTNGITKLLKNLNPYKAQGPDNLSPRILKELADQISPLLNLSTQNP